MVANWIIERNEEADGEEDFDESNDCWLSAMPVFRFTFMLNFVIFATGFSIMIFKRYKVNYLYIFALDPKFKVTHI